jgi:LPS sulfotransferase NodH
MSKQRASSAMPNLQDVLRMPEVHLKAHPLKYLSYEPGPTKLRNLERKAIIACTARSGSSFLSVSLRKYCLNFNEYLNTEGEVKRASDSGIKTTRQFGDYLAENKASKGMLSIKAPFVGVLYLTLFNEFPSEIHNWRVVFLRRKNVIRQAISMDVASKTKQWTVVMKAEREVRDDEYNFERLKRIIEMVNGENEKWERLFALFQLKPYRLFYEDFVEDQNRKLKEVAEFVGADTSAENPDYKQYLTVQSTHLNQRWEERFWDDMMQYAGELQLPVGT